MITGSFPDSNNHNYLNAIRRLSPILDIENGPWVAGGSVMNIFQNTMQANDIDIFCKDSSQHRMVWEFIMKNFLYSYIRNDYRKDENLSFFQIDKGIPLQLVGTRYFESLDSLLNDFDFTIVMAGTDGTNWKVGDRFSYDLRIKKLIVNNNQYRAKQIGRLYRYCMKGFTPGPETLSKIFHLGDEKNILSDKLEVSLKEFY